MGFKANFGTGDFSSVPYGTQDPAFENSVIGDWDRRIPDIETYDPEKKSGSCSIKTSSKTLVFQMFAHGYHGYHQDLPIFLHLFATYLWSPAAVPGPSWPRCSWCWSSAPPSHCRTPRRTFACRPRPCWRSSRSAWGASPAAAVVLPEAALEKHQGAPGWIHSKSVGPQDVRTREVHLFGAEPRREDNGNVGSAGIPPGVLFVPGLSATFPSSTMSLFLIHNFPHVHPCFIFRSSCNLLQSSICIYAGWWFGTFIIVP